MNEEISTKHTSFRYQDVLEKAGFTDKESQVYELLLQDGQLGINDLLKRVEYKRGDLYNILYSLRDKGAIEQTIKDHKIQFRPKDPYHLIEYLDKQKETFIQASATIEALLPQMFSEYNLSVNRPYAHYFEGIAGLKEIYDIFNNSGEKELLLIRSIYDDDEPDEIELIENQIRKQVENGIRVKAITPVPIDGIDPNADKDRENMIARCWVKRDAFSLPAQILIWGNTVAITSMRNQKISTLIENRDIALTFRIIFSYIWDSAKIT